MSPPLSLKSGILELPNLSDTINLEVIHTPEPTAKFYSEIQSRSFTQTSTVYTQYISSTPKTRHSPSPPSTNPQGNNEILTISSKKRMRHSQSSVFIDSDILPHTLHSVKNPFQYNTMTDEFLRTHPIFKASLPSLHMTTLINSVSHEMVTLMFVLPTSPKTSINSPFGQINAYTSFNFYSTF